MQPRDIQKFEGENLHINSYPWPLVGSLVLVTSVTVFFEIHQEVCCFAHIDARTDEIGVNGEVNPEAGEEIARQVQRRLRQFLQQYRWDIMNPCFGTGLHIQSPRD